jgi:hypothetical protein
LLESPGSNIIAHALNPAHTLRNKAPDLRSWKKDFFGTNRPQKNWKLYIRMITWDILSWKNGGVPYFSVLKGRIVKHARVRADLLCRALEQLLMTFQQWRNGGESSTIIRKFQILLSMSMSRFAMAMLSSECTSSDASPWCGSSNF